MALVLRGNGSGFFMTVTLVDTNNVKSTLEYELTSADMTEAQTDATAILTALGGVTNSKVLAYAISQRYEENAFSYPVGANNNIKARCVGQIKDQADKVVFEIPSPKLEIFVAASGDNAKIVDLQNQEFIAYRTIFQTGGRAFCSDGEILDFVEKGKRVSRGRGF